MGSDQLPVACLPYAGAGASSFFPWRRQAPSGLQLIPLQLPGREDRAHEESLDDVRAAVEMLLPEITTGLGGHRQVALFGHSLGAVLAYELARALEERTEIAVRHVFVSGSPGPEQVRHGSSAALDDEQFLARVEELAGYRHSAFEYDELREFLLPTLRADVAMHESYRPPAVPIEAPITCLRGRDDHLVPADDTASWRTATVGGCRFVELDGGHMYIEHAASEVLRIIAAELGRDAGIRPASVSS